MQKVKNFFTSGRFAIFIGFLAVYLVSTLVSWLFFNYVIESPDGSRVGGQVADRERKIDNLSLPKTEVCPINGAKFSKPEREVWEKRRPLAAVIENHIDSRPQSGLSYADVVYEAVAEGGITRFLGIFYCGASAQDVKIGPIRSARVYFIDWATEYLDPIFMHVGGANNICGNCPGGVKPAGQVASKVDAFRLMTKLGWRYSQGNDFDGGTNIGYPIVVRDQFRLGQKSAWEHSVIGFTDRIFEEAIKRGYGFENDNGEAWNKDFISWKFVDDSPKSPTATNISFSFWSNKPDYDVVWKYDPARNLYLRENGSGAHIDHETGNQLTAKNVVIQFVKEEGPVDKEGHMFYYTLGKGEALVFQNGDVLKGSWKKDDGGRTIFFDGDGKEIRFVRGVIWIEAIPAGNKVVY